MDHKKLQQKLDRQAAEIEKIIQADPEIWDMPASFKMKKEFCERLKKSEEEKKSLDSE